MNSAQAALLRDIFGNPFRPVKLPACPRYDGDGKAHGSDRPFEWSGPGSYPGACPVCRGTKHQCPWLTPTAVGLARAAYEERQADGTLCADRLHVLADCLESEGCDVADLLNHLRGRERCGECLGSGVVRVARGEPSQGKDDWPCQVCGKSARGGSGHVPPTCWVASPGPHVRGCWAVDLLTGRE